MSRMFCAGIAGLVVSISLVLTSCSLNDDNNVQPAIPVAYVALYNASPNAPDLNITVDSRQINSYPFRYSDYTGYLPFYTGARHIKFGPFGANNIVVDTVVNLVDKNAYSIFFVDDYSKASVLLLQDTAATPATNKAMIRFINLSPDADTLHLNIKGQAELGTGKAFKMATAFMEIDAQTATFELSGSGISLEVPDVNIQAGGFYTIVVRGYKTPPAGNKNVLSAEVIGAGNSV